MELNIVVQGIIAGIAFGVLAMIPKFQSGYENKPVAMTVSFINRFAIGLLTFTADFNLYSWLTGIIIGFLLSLPEAIFTKDYRHVLFMGMLGGLICGEVMWIIR